MKTIGYLIYNPQGMSDEEKAGWNFLSSLKEIKAIKIPFAAISRQPFALKGFDLIWWHFDSSLTISPLVLEPEILKTIRQYVQDGGALLLSLLAAPYIVDLGLEDLRPNFVAKGPWDQKSWAEDYPDIRGFASFQGHPIFDGFGGGVYTWNPSPGVNYSAALYDKTIPSKGSVVGIERLYIKLNEQWRIISEYQFGKGKALTIGTFFFFKEEQTRFRKHLEKFALRCFSYLTAKPAQQLSKTYWAFGPQSVRSVKRNSKPIKIKHERWQNKLNGLLIKREFASLAEPEQFYDVGGRRILIMGKERGGIQEVWCHPLRILSNVKTGFKIGTSEAQSSASLNPQVIIEPEAITRIYHIGVAVIEEVTFGAYQLPGGAIHYRIDSKEPVEILLTGQIDLRLMWPLNEQASGSLLYAWDDGLQGFVVTNQNGELVSIVGCTIRPLEHCAGQFSSIQEKGNKLVGEPTDAIHVTIGLRLRLNENNTECTVAFAGSNLGEKDAVQAYKKVLSGPSQVLEQQANYFRSFQKQLVQFNTPDEEFNEGYNWAIAATDRFFVETPKAGSSFVAGYGLSTSGWDGGQKISGRPGYAWYFGRDSVWTSFAVLDYGDFDKVKSTLEFLGKNQDVNGKILHELTTSAYSHFDAADSTPLYIILMGRYLRASGDIAFVRREFERLSKAIGFCFSTDTDGDHLIENTNVGHGWVESGKFQPVHTEHYLASCWFAALKEASVVAQMLEKNVLAKKWHQESETVREIVKKEYWNAAANFYNFGKLKDGTYNQEKTVLPAVGIYLGASENENATQCLTEYASHGFSTDWGTRIISSDNAMYNPKGYHYGSVWPLFTGWTALAEFKSYRPVQGYIHSMNNLLVYQHFAAGYVEEVMHGEQFQPAGVCHHQAWSETMVLQPILEGMLGLEFDALNNQLTLRPYFPPDWKTVEVKNIRLGKQQCYFNMNREGRVTSYEFRVTGSKTIQVLFQPLFSLGTEISFIQIGPKKNQQRKIVTKYDD
ncbi:MAG: DUF4960 domain-containing protein, partial [Ignavibacteriales bacterium]|nr:DUF4960 domain-containing protein [Ignavibacteriales bacterium]